MTTQLIYTVPSTLVDTYMKEGLIEFRDPLKPASLHGQEIVYMVRTRASTKRASADSNVVSVRTLPVPPAPTGCSRDSAEGKLRSSSDGQLRARNQTAAESPAIACIAENLRRMRQLQPVKLQTSRN